MNAIQQSLVAGGLIVGAAAVWLCWEQIVSFVLSTLNQFQRTAPDVVLPDAEANEPHAEPVRTSPTNQCDEDGEPVPSVYISRTMTKEDLITLLTVQRLENGDYRFSANKIVALVGGTESEVKKHIAALRPAKQADDAPKLAAARPGYEPYESNGKPPQLPREALGLK